MTSIFWVRTKNSLVLGLGLWAWNSWPFWSTQGQEPGQGSKAEAPKGPDSFEGSA